MPAADRPSNPHDPDSPVWGPCDFIGRVRLVRNLAGRLRNGQSVLLYGGPKLGKTSVLLQLQWLLGRSERSGVSRRSEYVDLLEPSNHDRLLAGEFHPKETVLLDHCEAVAPKLSPTVVQRLTGRGRAGAPRAIVWAGGRAWCDWMRTVEPDPRPHPVPLAVLLTGEAVELIGKGLTEKQGRPLLGLGGTHPYVLNVLRACVKEEGFGDGNGGMEAIVEPAMDRLAPFFSACLADVREPVERALLNYLIERGEGVNPREAAKTLGVPTIKPAADTLCYLGLISRWNLDEGAVLQATGGLLCDWYRSRRRP